MPRVSVEVPEKLVEAVRETVLLLYPGHGRVAPPGARARAEGEAGTASEAHAHRVRIDVLDELARALAAGPVPVRLTASRDLLHDMLYGALIDAGERLAALSGRGWRGDVPPGANSGGRRRGAVAPLAARPAGVRFAVPVERRPARPAAACCRG
jgi:hypothetical protein